MQVRRLIYVLADGIHSAVRKALFPDSKVIYQGYTCFRGMIDEVDIMNQYTADEYWGRRGRVGIVPLINNQAYWFITINANEKDPKYVSFENHICRLILIIILIK